MYSQKIVERNLAKLYDDTGISVIRYDDGMVDEMTSHLSGLVKTYDKQGKVVEWHREPTAEEWAYINNERVLCKYDFRYFANRYCNPPEAPIWMADGTFKPLGEISVGDEVMGWEQTSTEESTPQAKARHPRTSKATVPERFETRQALCPSRVIALCSRVAPIVKVTMSSGAVIRCTPDHLWSNGDHSSSQKWVTVFTNTPGVGGGRLGRPSKHRLLRRFVVPPSELPESLDRMATWLSGIYDGEGSCTGKRGGRLQIAQSESHNPDVCRAIEKSLTSLGFDYTKSDDKYGINGGRQALVNFLNWCKPIRKNRIIKAIRGFCDSTRDQVVSVVEDGTGVVISMQTTTGNYVAWGYASKNCKIRIVRPDGSPVAVDRMGKYGFMRTQEALLKRLESDEEAMYDAYDRGESVHGLLYFVHKCRQTGYTALARMMEKQRTFFWPDTMALAASENLEMVQELYRRDKMIWENAPWFIRPYFRYDTKDEQMEFAEMSTVTLFHQGNQKGGLGTGKTLSCVHLTEVALWDRECANPGDNTKKILEDLYPAIPRSLNTLYIMESTALGLGGFWYDQVELIRSGKSKFKLFFCPWYAADDKYAITAPLNWQPDEFTLHQADVAEQTSVEYLGYRVVPTREQMYWYEQTMDEHTGRLFSFFSNYPTTIEESFQNTGQCAFDLELLAELHKGIGPLNGAFDLEAVS